MKTFEEQFKEAVDKRWPMALGTQWEMPNIYKCQGANWIRPALEENYKALTGIVNPIEALLKVHSNDFEIQLIFKEHLTEINKAIQTTRDLLGIEKD